MRRTTPILLALLTGCLAPKLKPHTAKHAGETAAVCAACQAGECSEPVTWDVCETARQAACLDHIANGRECPQEAP
jgi:hypothetical protein